MTKKCHSKKFRQPGLDDFGGIVGYVKAFKNLPASEIAQALGTTTFQINKIAKQNGIKLNADKRGVSVLTTGAVKIVERQI